MRGLSEKNKKFCQGYLASGDRVQAYLDAGYEVKDKQTADINALRLLRRHDVQMYLKELQHEQELQEQEEEVLISDDLIPPDFLEELQARAALKPWQAKFCEEYVINGCDGRDALKRSGHKCENETHYNNTAYDLIRVNGGVRKYLHILSKKATKRFDIRAERVLQELKRLAFSDITDIIEFVDDEINIKDLNYLSRDISSSIKKITQNKDPKGNVRTTIEMHNKEAALESLMKYLGLQNDFNQAIGSLRKYGLELWRDRGGKWNVSEITENPNSSADPSQLREGETANQN